ncbi:hypothetical protein XNC3_1050004 [Xenorhabdus nematophila F1]|nr:hypothetical protein XNC3_1050004 [Xenorhabdus nematophila F1]
MKNTPGLLNGLGVSFQLRRIGTTAKGVTFGNAFNFFGFKLRKNKYNRWA